MNQIVERPVSSLAYPLSTPLVIADLCAIALGGTKLFKLATTKAQKSSAVTVVKSAVRRARNLGYRLSFVGHEIRAYRDERGQSISEYATLLAVILVVTIGTIRLIGSNANTVFSQVGSGLGN